MGFGYHAAIGAIALAAAGPGVAQEIIRLDTVEQVASAMQTAGYRAEIKTDDDGSRYIASSASGDPVTISFYGCDETGGACNSIQFRSYYKADPLYTAALANEWNNRKRFLKISVDEDGDLAEWLDYSVFGGVTAENFRDMIDWYEVMDAELANFLAEKRKT